MTDQIYIDGQQPQLLAATRYVLGRGDGCDILLPAHDAAISRKHALLQCNANSEWSITDLASSNGTFVNGQKITEPQMLRHGDNVLIGSSYLRLHAPRSAPVAPPVDPQPFVSDPPQTAPDAAAPTSPPTIEAPVVPETYQPQVTTEATQPAPATVTVEIPTTPGNLQPPVTTEATLPSEPTTPPTVEVPFVPTEPSQQPVTVQANFQSESVAYPTVEAEKPTQQILPQQDTPNPSDVTVVDGKGVAPGAAPQARQCSQCRTIYSSAREDCPSCGSRSFKTKNLGDDSATTEIKQPETSSGTPGGYIPPVAKPTENTPFDSRGATGGEKPTVVNPPKPGATWDSIVEKLNPTSYRVDATEHIPADRLLIPRVLSWGAAPLMLVALLLPWVQVNFWGFGGAFSYFNGMTAVASAPKEVLQEVAKDPSALLVTLPLIMTLLLIGAAVYAFFAHQSNVKTASHLMPQAILSLVGGVPGVLAAIWFYISLHNAQNQMGFIPIDVASMIGLGIPAFALASLVATVAGGVALALGLGLISK